MLHSLSIKQLHERLKNGSLSSSELTQHYLNRMDAFKSLNAYTSINKELALEQAKNADQKIQSGQMTPLTGIPIAHKDIFCTEKLPTTCASNMLEGYQSPFDATIVHNLNRAGAVTLGKTNMDEFAMGSTNESSYFGPALNPWDPNKVPGGSSGGSAVAVSAGLASIATGSDTGGSIRQPASFCGISGMKPTYGVNSRYGMVAYASSLDQAGPMARSVEDLIYVLEAMAGFDPKDSTSIDQPIPNFSGELSGSSHPLKIGIPSCFFSKDVDPEVQETVRNALSTFASLGAEIIELELTLQPYWVPCYYVIACAEASSNLARYDGVRYGHRAQSANTLEEMITRSRDEGFGLEVKRRILTGTFVLSAGYFDAYYVHAQKVRRMIQQELLDAFSKVDIVLGPTAPTLPFDLNQTYQDPTQQYLADVFTVAANLAGLPALSIPAGFSQSNLPIGMQLMAKPFNDRLLLSAGHSYQTVTDWHQKQPEETL